MFPRRLALKTRSIARLKASTRQLHRSLRQLSKHNYPGLPDTFECDIILFGVASIHCVDANRPHMAHLPTLRKRMGIMTGISNRLWRARPVISFSPLDGRSSSATGSRDTRQAPEQVGRRSSLLAVLIASAVTEYFPDGMPVPVAFNSSRMHGRRSISWIGFFLPLSFSLSLDFLFSPDFVARTILRNRNDAADGKVMCTRDLFIELS